MKQVLYCLVCTLVSVSLQHPLVFHSETAAKKQAKQHEDRTRSFVAPIGSPSDAEPTADVPWLANEFYADFHLYYRDAENSLPPWNGLPPVPFSVGRGRTYYSWPLQIAIEEYDDYCIPIFVPNSYWPCQFINYNNTAYLWTGTNVFYGPCCIYRQPWYPPAPWFLRAIPYNSSTYFREQMVDWYVLEPESPNPFGYAFSRTTIQSGHRIPATFWYPGNSGWAMQHFFNYTDEANRVQYLHNYTIPTQCINAPACVYVP